MLKLINIRFDCGFNERSAHTSAGQCIIASLVVIDANQTFAHTGCPTSCRVWFAHKKRLHRHSIKLTFAHQKRLHWNLHTKNGYTGTLDLHTKNGYTLDLHTKNGYTGTMLNLTLRNKNGYKNKLCTSKAVNNNFNEIAQRSSVSAPL